ncbi:MAG TPA: PTS sugar transporter subunit IIA [Pirellulales bacterium]|nr:PTS sugar transporter subunit IIA [Pirellulales bacterium]
MELRSCDVAGFLDVSESTVKRWVKQRGLPAHRINGRLRFNGVEVLEWANTQQVQVSTELFRSVDESTTAPFALASALEVGGIFYDTADSTRETALRAVVDVMPVPAGIDRQMLLSLLLAREAIGSTAIGDGIAIPHPRSPLVLDVARPSVTLCFLRQPVDFGAPDGQPVGVLFTMTCPTIRSHLQLLARLSLALHDKEFKRAVVGRASVGEILALARRIDEGIERAAARNVKRIAG